MAMAGAIAEGAAAEALAVAVDPAARRITAAP